MFIFYDLRILSYGMSRICFRNNKGHVLGHRGGGAKRKYMIVNYNYLCYNISGIVLALVYNSMHSARLALISYANGIVYYMISVLGLYPGFVIYSGFGSRFVAGTCFYLWQIPLGFKICNIELIPGAGSRVIRAAGTFGLVLRKSSNFCVIKLPSNELRLFLFESCAVIGRVSNSFNKFRYLWRAGVSRHLGNRPVVRGVAKNPVDHPHGGDTSGGRPSVSPWGKYTKGLRTRVSKNITTRWIVKHRLGFINKSSLIF